MPRATQAPRLYIIRLIKGFRFLHTFRISGTRREESHPKASRTAQDCFDAVASLCVLLDQSGWKWRRGGGWEETESTGIDEELWERWTEDSV